MLSTNDYKGILDLIEIIHDTSDRALMFKAFCEGLHKLVPICSAAYAPFGEKKTGFEFPGSLMYNLKSQPLYLFAEYYASKQPYLIAVTDEGVAKYLNTATNLTDVISPRRLKDSEYGTDFQPVAGVFYESCVILGTQGDSLGTMGLHRPRGDRDFSSREKRIVNYLLPHLARSFHLLGLTQGRFPSTENGELVLAEDGQPLSMNDEAKRILAGRPPSALPVCHDDASPTFFSTPTRIYRVRSLNHHPKQTQRTVFLAPWPPRHSIDAKLNALSLTRRQQEIVLLVIRGLSNRDIAERLFVTEQTVKDHLHDVFERFGIKRRTELLSRVLKLGPEDAES